MHIFVHIFAHSTVAAVGMQLAVSHSGCVLWGRLGQRATRRAAPRTLVLGDRDFTIVEHGALMEQLIPGPWQAQDL